MSLSKSLGKIGAYLLGEGIDNLKGNVDAKLEEIKVRVEIAVKHATKMLTVVILILIGAVFVLTGVAKYLSETVSGLDNGMGYVLVGVCVLFIGIIGRMFSNN